MTRVFIVLEVFDRDAKMELDVLERLLKIVFELDTTLFDDHTDVLLPNIPRLDRLVMVVP